jgi:hypothetical protein
MFVALFGGGGYSDFFQDMSVGLMLESQYLRDFPAYILQFPFYVTFFSFKHCTECFVGLYAVCKHLQ